eukprot:TRINITY_DN28321_c0_g1_i4.p1 TRINITY_DN28321_c0_g1~~TRINITY_DN28321_c0_g1_i4.p1  ORF type:complete len:474 (+),score=102.32 TRINITY_DN28321_c0_g1_i4:334-1755(+)
MAAQVELLVPEEYRAVLLAEFRRRCRFGDRQNSEFMRSCKFVRTLRDAGMVVDFNVSAHDGALSVAEVDNIFALVLRDCSYGVRQLTHELFCKALYLTAVAAWPSRAPAEAFGDLLKRVVSASLFSASLLEDDEVDRHLQTILDPRVILVLDSFKLQLTELFHACSGKDLDDCAGVAPGIGVVRAREAACWKSVGGLLPSTVKATAKLQAMGDRPLRKDASGELDSDTELYLSDIFTRCDVVSSGHITGQDLASLCAEDVAAASFFGLPEDLLNGDELLDTAMLEVYFPLEEMSWVDLCDFYRHEVRGYGGPPPIAHAQEAADDDASSSGPASAGSESKRLDAEMAFGDVYQYANAMPVLPGRRYRLSMQQWLRLCRQWALVPDLCSQVELVDIFKRLEGGEDATEGSVHGFLQLESFFDAVSVVALAAYSKSPQAEEYPHAAEKIQAFLQQYLPRTRFQVQEQYASWRVVSN